MGRNADYYENRECFFDARTTIWNMEAILAELKAEPWRYSHDGGQWERMIYLGSCWNLSPSGKMYTPWACSNVTENEALQDEKWQEKAELELSRKGLFMTAGEGSSDDLFAGECTDELDEGDRFYAETSGGLEEVCIYTIEQEVA